jgi:predicted dehydrogenase
MTATSANIVADSLDLAYQPVMPADRSVGIGCIGAGFIMSDCHLVAYRQAGFRPVAIVSRDAEKAAQVAQRHHLPHVCHSIAELVTHPEVQVVDVAVPPDQQAEVIRQIVHAGSSVRGILAQKPLGISYAEACETERLCRAAGITLAVNQNMRYDQSIRSAATLLHHGQLGEPVLATIDMRAIPHWMPWQERLGWVTLRIMSIHHLDTFRFWLGNPERVMCSTRPDPRTVRQFAHTDGICLTILEFANGARALAIDDVWAGPAREGAASDIGIRWRLEGTDGMARGTIGWPDYPQRSPSTIDFTTTRLGPVWRSPRWEEAWFPDAFAGPMAELLCSLEAGQPPSLSGADHLVTMAVVEACYRSAAEHRVVDLAEILG